MLPMLWLAGPVTGLLVQPVVGAMSDRTWCWLGRRRPYFLVGAILATLALMGLPYAGSVLVAAIGLWILDASANTSQGPYRAFVTDLLPASQRNLGFSMQGVMIGIGSVTASALPFVLRHFGVSDQVRPGEHLPDMIYYAFMIGAVVLLGCVLWSIISSPETPPADMEQFGKDRRQAGLFGWVPEMFIAISQMPRVMVQLVIMTFITWLGMFCVFIYLPGAIIQCVFDISSTTDPQYGIAESWGGICFAFMNVACFLWAMLLTALTRRLGRKWIHLLSLLVGGAGLLILPTMPGAYWALVPMAMLGIGWASIISLPFAMLGDAVPREKMGVYMGVFNVFVVLPQFVIALGFGYLMRTVFHENPANAMYTGGLFLILGGLATLIVQDRPGSQQPVTIREEAEAI